MVTGKGMCESVTTIGRPGGRGVPSGPGIGGGALKPAGNGGGVAGPRGSGDGMGVGAAYDRGSGGAGAIAKGGGITGTPETGLGGGPTTGGDAAGAADVLLPASDSRNSMTNSAAIVYLCWRIRSNSRFAAIMSACSASPVARNISFRTASEVRSLIRSLRTSSAQTASRLASNFSFVPLGSPRAAAP